MAKFLFWNLNKKPLTELIAVLAAEQRIDVLVLAECNIPEVNLLDALNTDQPMKFSRPFNPSPHFKFFLRYPRDCMKLVRDEPGIAIRRLVPPIGLEILMVAVHLPSKFYHQDIEQAFLCTRLTRYIEVAEQKVGHSRTIVFGDFNMNPFEYGVVAAEGLHAVMDKRIAEKRKRTVRGEERPFFYNPMWGNFGDRTPGPPGTYFYENGSQVCYFWYTYDQVILRPDLIEHFNDESLSILTQAGRVNLLSTSNRPDRVVGSDHFPITFELAIEGGFNHERQESLG
jgi:hypothetical protein